MQRTQSVSARHAENGRGARAGYFESTRCPGSMLWRPVAGLRILLEVGGVWGHRFDAPVRRAEAGLKSLPGKSLAYAHRERGPIRRMKPGSDRPVRARAVASGMGSTVASSVCETITGLPSQVLRRAGRGAFLRMAPFKFCAPKVAPRTQMHVLWRGDYPVGATHRKLNHGRQFSHKLQVQHGCCTSTSTLKLAPRGRRARSNCALFEVPRRGHGGGGRAERPGRRSGSARRGLLGAKMAISPDVIKR